MTNTSNMLPLVVSNVKFSAASEEDEEGGLLGYVTAIVNGALQLDGMTLRRTAEGRRALSFPARKDNVGRQHFYVRPISDEARLDMEVQVLRALGHEG